MKRIAWLLAAVFALAACGDGLQPPTAGPVEPDPEPPPTTATTVDAAALVTPAAAVAIDEPEHAGRSGGEGSLPMDEPDTTSQLTVTVDTDAIDQLISDIDDLLSELDDSLATTEEDVAP